MRERWKELRPKVLGAVVWCMARLVGLTLRVTSVNWNTVSDRLHRREGIVMVTWHGRTFVAANVYSGRGFWTLVSLSRDGEIQANIFRRFGFRIIRGSTRRGGIRAALQAAREVANGGVLAFTPDGPKGPSREVQQGALFIAQKSGRPLVPVGVSAWPRKLLPTWDRYLIPFPFARAVMIYGDPITVPKDANEAALRQLAERASEAINALEAMAEEQVRRRR